MEDYQTQYQPHKLSKIFATIIMVLFGINVFIFGLLYFAIYVLSDTFDVHSNEALLIRGAIGAGISLIFLVICITSVVLWKKGRGSWRYVMLGLGLVYLGGSIYLYNFKDEFELFAFFFYCSIVFFPGFLVILIHDFFREKEAKIIGNINT